MTRIGLIIGVLLTCIAQSLFAQKNILSEKNASLTLDAIYRFDEEGYKTHSANISDKAIQAYLAEYHALMHYAKANNEANFKAYQNASSNAISAVEKTTYGYTLSSNLLIHRCMAEMSMGNLLTSGIQFWKSYRAFKKGEEATPNYDGQLMLRGIFNVLLSQIPSKWQGLTGFFGFGSGNLTLGLEQIAAYRERVKEIPGLCEEGLVISFANIFLSHEQHINGRLSQAMKESPAPIISYAYLLSLGRQQKGAEADTVLSLITREQLEAFPLLRHQKSKIALRRLSERECIAHADSFFQAYKGNTCKSDALLLQAYAYLLLGDRTNALKKADACAAMTPTSDIDKRTQADAKRVASEDVTLLRSRFNFEYGNFAEALSVLDGYKPTSGHEIEYHFRLARAYEKLGDTQRAVSHYDKLIAMAGNDDRYFGPYSAVFMADMKIKEGDTAAAKTYIDKAKKLNNGEYSKEIEQRISLTTSALSKK